MWKTLLLTIALPNAAVTLFMWFAPELWSEVTPGVAMSRGLLPPEMH